MSDRRTLVAAGPVLKYGPRPLEEKVLGYERLLLIRELQHDHRTRIDTAKAIGCSIRTLYYKLEEHGLTDMTVIEARKAYATSWELLIDD